VTSISARSKASMQGDIWVVGQLLLHQEESLSQFVNNDFTHTHAMIM